MALLAEADNLELGGYVTLTQAAALKNTSYQTFRRWLARHREIEVRRINNVLVVRKDSLNKYEPRI